MTAKALFDRILVALIALIGIYGGTYAVLRAHDVFTYRVDHQVHRSKNEVRIQTHHIIEPGALVENAFSQALSQATGPGGDGYLNQADFDETLKEATIQARKKERDRRLWFLFFKPVAAVEAWYWDEVTPAP